MKLGNGVFGGRRVRPVEYRRPQEGQLDRDQWAGMPGGRKLWVPFKEEISVCK